ncbi:MAG: hypothetical protein NVSMB9_32260 [Isosphaeraceae bacterium]
MIFHQRETTGANIPRPLSALLPLALSLVFLGTPGCGPEIDVSYGRARSESLNGTRMFFELYRARGHEVRTAVRLTGELRDWADVIVRFALTPGPPSREEADWYDRWLNAAPGRRLVYVPRDYDATHEYWSQVLAQLPQNAPERLRQRIEEARAKAEGWENRLPPRDKHPASPDAWFELKDTSRPEICKKLGAPWSIDVDPSKARLTRHDTLKARSRGVLLSGDGEPLAITWSRGNGSRVLVPASATFLLNLPLVVPERARLALRTVDWSLGIDEESSDDAHDQVAPKQVAFVEGAFLLDDPAASPSVFALLQLFPFGWVVAQLFALGLAACLAQAPRLGRPRPGEPSGADRPVAHPEALGALLARSAPTREARALLDAYRLWRGGTPRRASFPSPSPPPENSP